MFWQQNKTAVEKSAEGVVPEKKNREGLNFTTYKDKTVKLARHGAVGKDVQQNTSPHYTSGNGKETRERGEPQMNTASEQNRTLDTENLMERVVDRDNLNNAYKRVVGNKGSPGVDGIKTNELKSWLIENGGKLAQELLTGTYQPMPVRRVDIPKPKGGMRQLGIPTVVDRLVQQAMSQVLDPILDPTFSESSYGFRPRRSAHQALAKAKEYVANDKWIVVDIDIEKYFDNVNHDKLMVRLARHVKDKTFLRLVRKFLQAGIMHNGVCINRKDGTPQGGPLSPILANLFLDDLDKELERRGHDFCRYADDCNIYVGSIKAGERVMDSVREFLAKKLSLKINTEKSAVSPCSEENFPGIHHPEHRYVDHIEAERRTREAINQNDNPTE